MEQITTPMTAQEALESVKGITFEQAWAIMEKRYEEERKKREEEQKKREEEQRAAEKKREEEQRIRDEKRAEEMAKFERNINKVIGRLGNSIGELTETMFSGALHKKFKELGYEVEKQSIRHKIYEGDNLLAEVDCWIENGEFVIAVEVKTDLENADINDHIERIERIRSKMDRKGDKRKIVGAVAGGMVNERVINYAHKKGLYVIMQSGESAVIVDRPEGFKARIWE